METIGLLLGLTVNLYHRSIIEIHSQTYILVAKDTGLDPLNRQAIEGFKESLLICVGDCIV